MNPEVYEKYEIIDAHAHIFPEKIAENATINIGHFYGIPMNGCGMSSKLIHSGSRIGVAKYLVCSTATTPHQIRNINSFISTECTIHTEYYGLGTTHADSDDLEGDITQIMELGLHGVKLHPDFQKFNADSPEAFKIYELMEGKLPLMIHCGDNRYDYSSPVRIANICKNFPKLKVQAAHMGGYRCWEQAVELLPRKYENLCIDISSSMPFMSPQRAAEIIRKYGVENALFGVDYPMWDHTDELERFLACGFSKEENRLILAENFKRFYGLE